MDISFKVIMQGKYFRGVRIFCTAVYCLWWMSKPDMGFFFYIKNQWIILVIGNYYVNSQNYQNLILLSSSDTRRTLMHLFLFTNSAQKELGSIWYTQLQLTFLALKPWWYHLNWSWHTMNSKSIKISSAVPLNVRKCQILSSYLFLYRSSVSLIENDLKTILPKNLYFVGP